MPVTVDDDGLSFSSAFQYQALFWLDHPSLGPDEIAAALSQPTTEVRRAGDGADNRAASWLHHLPPGTDLAVTLDQVADRLAVASSFLNRVRDDGGRYGCLVLCHVDFNAGQFLDARLLRRLGDLGCDLTLQVLDVETPQTSEGMRQFLEIMNRPPATSPPITDPAEQPEPDADGPP